MSKKVLNYAGRRPMLLAFLVMATFTLGLLFSGWLTPIPGKAQPNQPNPQLNNEATDCVKASISTNSCSEGTVTFAGVIANPPVACIGSSVGASVNPPTITPGQVIIDTSYTNANPNATNTTCDDTFTTNNPPPIPTYTWTASGCGIGTNGMGLSTPALTPTNCGTVTVIFTAKWHDTCDTNTSSASVSGNINVDAVTSLTPSAGQWVDDGDGDPNTDTYLVQYGCYDTITVTAGDCLGLGPDSLPSCWSMTCVDGIATKIDNKTYSVDGHTVGTTVVNVTCGISHKSVTIIVYKAKFEADSANNPSWGHAWWVLSVEPNLDDFLTLRDKKSQGVGGYYNTGDTQNDGMEWPGPQPVGGSTTVFYNATGLYWWCISFAKYVGALTYVNELFRDSGIFQDCWNNCVSQTKQVASASGVTLNYSGIPCDNPSGLSDYLNELLPNPSSCTCQQ